MVWWYLTERHWFQCTTKSHCNNEMLKGLINEDFELVGFNALGGM